MVRLTRIRLNPQRRATWRLQSSLESLHAAVEKGFPTSDHGRVLWRLDSNEVGPVLYVVSESEPDYTGLVEECGWPRRDYNEQVESVGYDNYLNRIQDGQRVVFRLRFNSVKAKNHCSKLTSVIGENALSLVSNRLAPALDIETIRQVEEEHPVLVKAGHRFNPTILTFEGSARVKNAGELRRMLTAGIGRMKAYGCGLLTVMPIPEY